MNGSHNKHRQDEKKTPDPARERHGERDTETGTLGMGAVSKGTGEID